MREAYNRTLAVWKVPVTQGALVAKRPVEIVEARTLETPLGNTDRDSIVAKPEKVWDNK